MSNFLIPNYAKHRIHDLFSPQTSAETKANAARWYAEMVMDKFLLVPEDSKKKFAKKIKIISESYDNSELVSNLKRIANIGNKGSHHEEGRVLSAEEGHEVVQLAMSLLNFVLVEYFKSNPFRYDSCGGTIFSTLLPSIRVEVLSRLLRHEKLEFYEDYEVFHKYLLACTKDGRPEDAYAMVDSFEESGFVDEFQAEYERRSIEVIDSEHRKQKLMVAKNSHDCRRNFNDVMSQLSARHISDNSKLIEIIEYMLEAVEPSDPSPTQEGGVMYLV
ncbi:hypothetical protein [Maridesulfovibrio sp.]|uniref:hypothetical protein n=1 Tax=Maridesulfovibrio sp. TaxID=2795000 RepID=UPI0029F5938F|nr:hypothetical protein [Maridesulfovibrio sp.]